MVRIKQDRFWRGKASIVVVISEYVCCTPVLRFLEDGRQPLCLFTACCPPARWSSGSSYSEAGFAEQVMPWPVSQARDPIQQPISCQLGGCPESFLKAPHLVECSWRANSRQRDQGGKIGMKLTGSWLSSLQPELCNFLPFMRIPCGFLPAPSSQALPTPTAARRSMHTYTHTLAHTQAHTHWHIHRSNLSFYAPKSTHLLSHPILMSLVPMFAKPLRKKLPQPPHRWQSFLGHTGREIPRS